MCPLLTGCATLFSDDWQDITVTSNVEGATVMLDGKPVGKTPLRYELARDTFKRHVLTVRKDGYRSRTVPVRKSLNSTALFNCTSWLFWGTDALSGNMMEYSPDSFYIELEPRRRQRASAPRDAMWLVLANSRAMIRDIASGGGEYLTALSASLGVPDSDRAEFYRALRADFPRLLAAEYPHQLFDRIYAVRLRQLEHAGLARLSAEPAGPLWRYASLTKLSVAHIFTSHERRSFAD